MTANMIFKWLRDPRYVPDPEVTVEGLAADTPCFLPVEIVDRPRNDEPAPTLDPKPTQSAIDVAGGHRLRIIGGYTLIETAKLNGVDPQAWLADTLARISDYKITRVGDLLPRKNSE